MIAHLLNGADIVVFTFLRPSIIVEFRKHINAISPNLHMASSSICLCLRLRLILLLKKADTARLLAEDRLLSQTNTGFP
jgi:hypothetical protein